MKAALDRSSSPRLCPASAVFAENACASDSMRRCVLICLRQRDCGAGNHVTTAGVEVQAPSRFDGALTDKCSWSLHWAGDVAYWWTRNHSASNSSLWEMGVTPVISVRHAAGSVMSSYLEAGIDIHLLSHTRIDERILSTAFQFGEFLGTGVNFGDREQYSIGVRIQHI